jgi:hypothetical protein
MELFMSRTLPTYITPPALEAYPLITARLIYSNPNIDLLGDDQSCPYDDAFDRASILTAMTGPTFSRLSGILKLRLNDTAITSKSQLSTLAHRNADLYAIKNSRAHQIAANLLGDLTIEKYLHWGDLTSLYNESSPDQQRAISDYFKYFQGRTLIKLLNEQAPAFELPANAEAEFLSKTENGQTFLFSDIQNAWLRDDVFHRQFVIKAVRSDLDKDIITCAPTLDLALFKATAFTLALGRETHYIALQVQLNGKLLAGATTAYAKGYQSPMKLTWNLGKVGLGLEHKKISAHEGDINATFTDTLLAAEKAMGVQWSKVRKLEDELGL